MLKYETKARYFHIPCWWLCSFSRCSQSAMYVGTNDLIVAEASFSDILITKGGYLLGSILASD